MGLLTIAKIVTQILSNMCLLIAVCLTFVAMFSSQWLIAVIGNNESYLHGLYRDCDENPNAMTRTTWVCHWKFVQESDPTYKNDVYQLHDWQVRVMALLGTACSFAILATLCACVTCCLKHCSIAWAVLSLMAAILSLSGLIVFFRYSQDRNIRVFTPPIHPRPVEQQFGQAFELAVSGCVLFFIGALLALLGLGIVFVEGRKRSEIKSNNHQTNFGHTTKV